MRAGIALAFGVFFSSGAHVLVARTQYRTRRILKDIGGSIQLTKD